MKCAKCGAENPESKKFCGECGSAIKPVSVSGTSWKKGPGVQAAFAILVMSVFLLIVAYALDREYRILNDQWMFASSEGEWEAAHALGEVSAAFYDMMWVTGVLGIIGVVLAAGVIWNSYRHRH